MSELGHNLSRIEGSARDQPCSLMRPRRVDTRVEAMRCDAGSKQLWLDSKVTARGETGEDCHVLSRGGYRATVLPCYRALNGNGTLQRWWWGACISPETGLGRF